MYIVLKNNNKCNIYVFSNCSDKRFEVEEGKIYVDFFNVFFCLVF